ncbi:IS607 family transposase [Streptomyces antibioticus]|uniref:IS607 family transposase n=1 Tax=Streptomyces antibioticus TaxID=1890 RepID=A0AAE6Y7M8_STRAT|nr:IS607 family transposase [Streptomyces antibioticus]MCX4738558.1 IS607 family transposase [Streptomyces antibioticus]MCX5169661.1 IS607 family transposase [Streptomyces antibioticus]OOQ50915.1 resolvase [Streptomyces antibioticus]QIT45060.1 IS607 family transposase [Streptomyces antibioticus]
MNLTEWAKTQGVHPQTAYRWFRDGTLPVPAQRVGPRTILVNINANTTPEAIGGLGLYARVSSHDQKTDLERQVARLSAWAAKAGHRVVRVEAEIASGMNGCRSKARRLLADPNVITVVVEHKDRLGRTNVELVEATLSAAGRRLLVLDDGEAEDDPVRDMMEAMTSFCARLYGRRSARNRARKALEAAKHG